jgi:putative toxin-antitoxin system antitoxin component (TIGR02293 family)
MPTKATSTRSTELPGISEVKRQRPPKRGPKDLRVKEYARVLAHAVDTFGSQWKADAWLNRPNRIFNQRSPLQVLTVDPTSVDQELIRIDHGMVS